MYFNFSFCFNCFILYLIFSFNILVYFCDIVRVPPTTEHAWRKNILHDTNNWLLADFSAVAPCQRAGLYFVSFLTPAVFDVTTGTHT